MGRVVLSLRVDAELVARLDAGAARVGLTRAALVEQLLRHFLAGELALTPSTPAVLVALNPVFRGRS